MGSSRGLKKLQERNIGSGDLHRRFNIFTRDGQNRSVTAPTPMTLEQAQDYYNCLCIGADD